jgi:hypothetical protein
LLDLWERNIPTLEEYGQAITAPLKLHEQAFLTRPAADRSATAHFVVVRAINVPVLESLGVRFVLTDGTVSQTAAQLRQSIEVLPSVTLRLYELNDPNLGDLSPAEVRIVSGAGEVVDEVIRDPMILKRVAMVSESIGSDLVPASQSRFAFVRQGATLDAESHGSSAVLLPMQFSHCMTWTATGPGTVEAVVRANLLHTLVVFTGSVHVHFEWEYGPWASRCRREDARDFDRLGVPDALASLADRRTTAVIAAPRRRPRPGARIRPVRRGPTCCAGRS